MKILLLLFCLMSLPINGYTQFVTRNFEAQEISAESKILIEQAKNNGASSSKKRNTVQDTEGFNLAVTSSFTGGFIPDYTSSNNYGSKVDLFNTTSLEFYLPALASTPKTRFLMTARFFTPVLEGNESSSLYNLRLGYGIGFSSTIFDGRNKKGQGWTGNINLLFSQDFNFLDQDDEYYFIGESSEISRIDFSMRWNHFISRHLALVFGLDFGGGFAFEEYERQLGSDGYPVEPLTPYGSGVTGIINVGLTAGFMF